MDHEGGGKSKSKRSHGSKPYERKQSFLSRIKNAAYGLLMPSWKTEIVDNNTENEVVNEIYQEIIETQPSTPSRTSHKLQTSYHHVDTPRPVSYPVVESSSTNTRLIHPSASQQIFSSSSEYRRVSNIRQASDSINPFDKKDANGDDQSECSESTSGCSSMLPHPDKREYQKVLLQESDASQRLINNWDKNKVVNKVNHSQQPHSDDASSDTKQSQRYYRGLWSIDEDPILSKPQTSARDSALSFNVSAFGTAIVSEHPSVFGDTTLESPFYGGKTRYGGALNHRKSRLQATSPYHRITPVHQKIKVKTVANCDTSEFGMTSNTARRILEVLEKMSTPLSDAKKIPTPYIPDTPLSFQVVKQGPPKNNISTPSRIVISKNLQTCISSKTDNKVDDNNSKESRSKSEKNNSKTQAFELCKNSGGGKMKRSRLKENHHFSSTTEGNEFAPSINLPQIPLPITNLPKLNFEIPFTSSSIPCASVSSSPVFEFSIPIVPDGPFTSVPNTVSTAAFKFSSPLAPHESISGNTSLPKCNINFQYKPSSSLKQKKSPGNKELIKEENGKDESVRFRPAAEMKSGSVSDILSQGWGDKYKPPSGSWECSECLVYNKAEVNFCEACQTSRPESYTNEIKSDVSSNNATQCLDNLENKQCNSNNCGTISNNCNSTEPKFKLDNAAATCTSKEFGKQFKLSSDLWECLSCFVRNEVNLTKCKACDSFKTGVNSSNTEEIKSINIGFDPKFLKPKDMWECDICSVTNKANDVKCIACQSSKPEKNIESEKEPFKFNFKNSQSDSVTSGTGFVFDSTSVTNTTSTFTFGNSTSNTKIENTPSSGFIFSSKSDTLEKNNNDNVTSGFQFSTLSKNSSNTGFCFGKTSIPDVALSGNSVSKEITISAEQEKPSNDFSFIQTKTEVHSNDKDKQIKESGFKFSFSTPQVTNVSSTETKTDTGFTFISNSNNSMNPAENVTLDTTQSSIKSHSDSKVVDSSSFTKTQQPQIQPADNSGSETKLQFEFNSQTKNNSNNDSANKAINNFQFSFSKDQPQVSKHKLDNDPASENKMLISPTFSFGSSLPPTSSASTFSILPLTSTATSSQTPMFTFSQSSNSFTTTAVTTTSSKTTAPIFTFNASLTTTSTTVTPTFSITTTAAALNTSSSSFSFKPISTTSSVSATTFSFAPVTTSTSGFGLTNFTTSAGSTPSFTFTASAPSTNFGISTPTPTFGVTTASCVSSFGATSATPVTNALSFGFSNPTTTATPIFGSITPAFGSNNTSTSGNNSMFNAGSGIFATGISTSTTTPFGNLPAATTSAGFLSTSTPSFAFGSQPSQPTSFVFTGNQAASSPATGPQSQAPVSGAFSFGNQPSFSTTPNFNFGAPQSSGPFQFSATPSPQSNPFSIPSSSSTQRKYKRAVRKIHK